MYGIRVRRKPTDRWTRVRTKTHPAGKWSSRGPAVAVLAILQRRGYAGHVFELSDPVVYPTKTHYSPNFTRAELECKGPECGGKRPPAHIEDQLTMLASNLELLRDELDGPLGIQSGYRCPIHNARVHGASLSQHMRGTAADLVVAPGAQARYVNAAERVQRFNRGGIGVYPHGGVHVDIRPTYARWNDWVRT